MPEDVSLLVKGKPPTGPNFRLDEAFDIGKAPMLWAVGFCVLSHHRIPEGRASAGTSHRWSAANHLHQENSAPLRGFSRPCGGWKKAVSGNWSIAVSRCAARLVEQYAMHGFPTPAVMAGLAVHVVRNVVILGDHLASAAGGVSNADISGDAPHKKPKWVPHAKTAQRGEETVLGDTWSMHTARGMLRADAALRTLAAADVGMPHLRMNEVKAAPASGRFAWQETAFRLMEKEAGNGPALVFLLAGTGTGKTRAAFRMITAGRDAVRVTSLLGLRTLTLQTGSEYAQRGGLPSDKVAAIIGSPLELALQEAYTRDDGKALRADPPSPTGSDADLTPAIKCDISPNTALVGVLPPLLQSFCQEKLALAKFLAMPVVACTVDMLAPVSDAVRGSHLAALIRLCSSDIIVDELDSYDTEDAQAICRLAYHSALSGRRFVAASATMPPSLMCAVHEAYASGARLRSDITGRTAGFAVVLASESACDGWAAEGQKREDFRTRVTNFVAQQAAILAVRTSLRRASLLRLGGDWKSDVTDGIVALHAGNRLVDPVSGRGFSTGFVRLNVTRDARALARQLMEQGIPGVSCRVLCYHARFSVGVRSEVDRQLNAMFSRKHDASEPDPIFADPHVRRALDDGGTDDVVVIVVSTPLIELGRDFDFDWAVVEPSSVSSVIQSAGRVLRHRPWRYGENINVIVMSRTLDEGSLKRQGMFRSIRIFAGATDFRPMPIAEGVENLFPLTEWRQSLDARDSLLPFSPGSRHVEARRDIAFTGEARPDFRAGLTSVSLPSHGLSEVRELSLRAWLETPSRSLTDAQARFRKFRRKTDEDLVLSLDAERWMVHETRTSEAPDKQIEGSFNGKIVSKSLSASALSRSLFPRLTFDVLAQARRKSELLEKDDEMTRRELTYVTLGINDMADLATLRVEFVAELGIDRIRRAV